METWLHPREGNAWDIHVGEQPENIKFSKKTFLGWYFSYQTQAQTKKSIVKTFLSDFIKIWPKIILPAVAAWQTKGFAGIAVHRPADIPY